MLFDLVRDFADVLDAMPREHPRYRIVKLLDEAVRRDVHFIDRHPTTFFQCMWNTCWWYDCPEAAGHYVRLDDDRPAGAPPWMGSNDRLHVVLENWRKDKESDLPGFAWLRSRRPPALHLGSALRAIFLRDRARPRVRFSAAFSADGGRVIVSVGPDRQFWDVVTGARLPSADNVEIWRDGLTVTKRDGKIHVVDSAGRVHAALEPPSSFPGNHFAGEPEPKAVSPDGRTIAFFFGTGSGVDDGSDGRIWVWQRDQDTMRCLIGHYRWLGNVAFPPTVGCLPPADRTKPPDSGAWTRTPRTGR